MTKLASKVSLIEKDITAMDWLFTVILSLPIIFLPAQSNYFVGLLSLFTAMGGVLLIGLIQQKGSFNSQDSALRVLPRCVLFILIPPLIALIDAPPSKQELLIIYPLFGLMALAVLILVRAKQLIKPISILVSCIVFIWLFNAWSQLLLGMDMFNRLFNGIRPDSFFATHSDFGFYLGVFATTPLYTLYILGKNRLTHLLAIMWITASVLLMSQFSVWIMYIVAILPYLYLNFVKGANRPIIPLILAPTFMGVVVGIIVFLNPHLQQILYWGQYQQLIWQMWPLVIEVFQQHWFNGVGVGNFGATFQGFLAPNAEAPLDISHPHQFLLQVSVETGICGVIGILLLAAALVRLWVQANVEQRKLGLPLLMPLIALWWPINAHRDFYSVELAGLSFFLLALIIAALTQQSET